MNGVGLTVGSATGNFRLTHISRESGFRGRLDYSSAQPSLGGTLFPTMTKSIRQTVFLPAVPGQVYSALLESKQHAQFTGAPAKISAKVGGTFTCYDGYISGVNVELVPARRIVQAWRSQGWPKGCYSLVTFEFAKAPRGTTKLSFAQFGVPAGDVQAKSKGWRTHYWTPLKALLKK